MCRIAVLSLIFFWIFFFSGNLFSQVLYTLTTSQTYPSTDWKEIETDNFRIIFPSGIEEEAQYIANMMEKVYPNDTKTLKIKPKKLPIILYTQLADANGMATYAPRRSEWYLTSPQSSFTGSSYFPNVLGVHEYRHIVQMDKYKQGTYKAVYVVFGESFYIGSVFLFGTNGWFLEGDATMTETLLSDSGRGRLPSFDSDFRAQLLSGKRYSYYQAFFGTYKQYAPLASPYLMGYYMVGYGRKKYGADYWDKVIDRTTEFPPHRFSGSMGVYGERDKKSDGFFYQLFSERDPDEFMYDSMLDDLADQWERELDKINPTDADVIQNVNTRNWTFNFSPQAMSDGSVVVYRYGLEDVPMLVKIDPDSYKEEKIAKIGLLDSPHSAAGNRIVWAETIPQVRFGLVSFSEIFSYDTSSKRVKRLTYRNSRLYSPSLSDDGTKVVTLEVTKDLKNFLVVLDSSSGVELVRFEVSEDVQCPRWMTDNKNIAYISVSRTRGKSLKMINTDSGTIRDLLPYSHNNIMQICPSGQYIYFVSNYSGIDNVYALRKNDSSVFQVTSRKFGAYNPSVTNDGYLLFNDVTSDGHVAAKMKISPEKWIPLGRIKKSDIEFYKPLIDQEAGGSIFKDIPDNEYPVKKYNHIKDSVNIHSWGPGFSLTGNGNNITGSTLTLSVYSMNLLGTLYSSLGYIYSFNEQKNAGKLEIAYAGLYPVLTFDFLYGQRGSTDSDKKNKSFSWNETSTGMGANLPLNFSEGIYQTYFSVGASSRFVHVSNMPYHPKKYYGNGDFLPVTYNLSFLNGYKWFRDINPVFGQKINVQYTHTPIKSDYSGKMLSADAFLFFPGVLKHHSLYGELAYEKQDLSGYRFQSLVLFPKGYKFVYYEKFYKASGNYTLPLIYSDWNLGGMIHFKMFFSNLYYDYGKGDNAGKINEYRSAGVEFMSETYLFTVPIPWVIGLRTGYLFNDKKTEIGLVFGVMMQY